MILASAYMLHCLTTVTTLDERKKSEMEVSPDWYVAVEY